MSRSDLVSAGMLGLAQAARSFDPERGIAFDRFASTRIRGALLDELRGRDWASRSVRSRARGLQATQEELTNRLGRAPKPEEVARTLGVAPETVHKLVDDVHRATVLNYDSLVVEGDAESFIASNDDGPEDTLLDRERKAYLMDAVGALPERLRRVVIGYFFEERSMQDLADELGVSESRISQLRAEALLLLRDGVNSQLEPDAVPAEPRPNGRVARRKASYYAAVAAGSDYRTRLSARPIEADEVVEHVEPARPRPAVSASDKESLGRNMQRRFLRSGNRPADQMQSAPASYQRGRRAQRALRTARVHHGGDALMIINTNIMALNAYNNLQNTQMDLIEQPREAVVGLPDQQGFRRRVGPGDQRGPEVTGLGSPAGDLATHRTASRSCRPQKVRCRRCSRCSSACVTS